MLVPERDQRHFEGGLSDTVLDARRMSTSIAAQSYAARKPKNPNKHSKRKSSRKMTTQNVLGAAVAGCVLLAGWTVYNNIFAASVFPTVGSAGYDEPVVKRAPRVALREAGEAIRETFALLPDRLQVAAPISREMFNERFAAAATQGVDSNAASAAPATRVAEAKDTSKDAAKPTVVAKVADVLKSPAKAVEKIAEAAKTKRTDASMQLASADPAEIVPAPEVKPEAKPKSFADRAKAAVMSITGPRQSMVEKLWGKREPSGGLLAYASADASVTSAIAPKEQNPMFGGAPPYERDTAVYDITAKTVYLPDGTKLEAHSGLGENLDDPRSQRVRMRGVTPPHIYNLKPREALFHGVPALRLTPVGGENAIYGRDGLLAHTFMLGPNGDSNGCVSFKDYYAFLDAYRNKGIRKLAVLARVD